MVPLVLTHSHIALQPFPLGIAKCGLVIFSSRRCRVICGCHRAAEFLLPMWPDHENRLQGPRYPTSLRFDLSAVPVALRPRRTIKSGRSISASFPSGILWLVAHVESLLPWTDPSCKGEGHQREPFVHLGKFVRRCGVHLFEATYHHSLYSVFCRGEVLSHKTRNMLLLSRE